MRILTIDCETIPNMSIPESCRPTFDPDSIKLGNLKDPIKIEAKLAEEREAFEGKLCKTMSTDPALCQVCTFVGIEFDTDAMEPVSEVAMQLTAEDENDDLEIITNAWNQIHKAYQERIPLVTFNGIGFDLPVLLFRAICQDVPVDRVMYDRLTMKYKNQFHYDLMQALAGWDKQRWNKLEFYLNLFGIGTKGGMDGSQVYSAYMVGEYDKIKSYCRNDVMATSKLFARVAPWYYFELEGADRK